MKKFLTIVLGLLLCLNAVTACAEQRIDTDYDFKKFKWGASMAEVKAIEGEPLVIGTLDGNNSEYIAYYADAVGLDMLLGYYFCDEGLYQTKYISQEEHTNNNLYIDDYETFRSAMTKKYGEPLLDYVNWDDDSMKEYCQETGKMGDALCYGYCTYFTWYSNDRTNIYMLMCADNYEITMTIDYFSRDIEPEEADFSDEI